MSELEKTKNFIVQNMHKLCAHCMTGTPHDCPIQKISQEVLDIQGVPLIVNAEFKGVIFR